MEVSLIRRPGTEAAAAHFGLAAFLLAVLTLAPPRATAQCVNLAGNWNGSESGTITLVLVASDPQYDDNETDPVNGRGQVTMTQTGRCTFQYIPIGINGIEWVNPSQATRAVTVSGNNVVETGILVEINTTLAQQQGCTITSVSPNVENGAGPVTGDVLTLNETGNAVVTGSCLMSGQNVDFTLTITSSTTATLVAVNPLSLSVTVAGSGIVTSTDGTINCPTVCSSSYLSGSQVTLNATPTQGAEFSGWSGACSGTNPSCSLIMTQSVPVTATFNETLTVSTLGSGQVTSSDGFINCPGTCTHNYPPNTPVTLDAASAPPAQMFFGWCSGPCTGTDPCTVNMTQPQSVGALFYPLDGVSLEPGGPNDKYRNRQNQPTSMYASFTPTGSDLKSAAGVCGFQAFDWSQTVEENKGGVWQHDPLKELRTSPPPPNGPFLDPPFTGYTSDYDCAPEREWPECGDDRSKKCPYPPDCDVTGLRHPWLLHYRPGFAGANPFYFSVSDVVGDPVPACAEGPPNGDCSVYITSQAGTLNRYGNLTLNFWDWPANITCQPRENCFAFSAQLVGVCSRQSPSPVCNQPTNPPSAVLYQWTWESNYNRGTNLGCVSITSVNGSPVEHRCTEP